MWNLNYFDTITDHTNRTIYMFLKCQIEKNYKQYRDKNLLHNLQKNCHEELNILICIL